MRKIVHCQSLWQALYAKFSAATTDLHSGLTELCPLRQLLPGVHVRVLRALERSLQLLDLLSIERGAGSSLLALQGNAGLRVDVAVVISCSKKMEFMK